MANIELDGANKKIKVDSGDLTLDVPGDIILDADGADAVSYTHLRAHET